MTHVSRELFPACRNDVSRKFYVALRVARLIDSSCSAIGGSSRFCSSLNTHTHLHAHTHIQTRIGKLRRFADLPRLGVSSDLRLLTDGAIDCS